MQSEEVQALEDQHGRELMDLQTEANSARARAAAAESAASASTAKVSSLTQELAAAEAALTAARQDGEEALAAARVQYELDLQQEQQKLREAKGVVRRQEEEWHLRIAALEVSNVHPVGLRLRVGLFGFGYGSVGFAMTALANSTPRVMLNMTTLRRCLPTFIFAAAHTCLSGMVFFGNHCVCRRR